jgi:hypothetical protein
MAAAHAGKEALWFRNFMKELGFDQNSPTPLYVDNQSAIAIAKNPESHSRMKHIDLRYHFIQERVKDGSLELLYIPTGDQLADALTKALPNVKLNELRDRMGLRKVQDSADAQ